MAGDDIWLMLYTQIPVQDTSAIVGWCVGVWGSKLKKAKGFLKPNFETLPKYVSRQVRQNRRVRRVG
jgi:hypothetical protein